MVEQRSYSRNWGRTSCEAETCTSGSSRAQPLGDRAARGSGRGRRTAGRRRPTRRRCRGSRRRAGRASPSGSGVDHALAGRSARGRRSAGRARTSGDRLRRAEAVEVGAVLAGDLEQVGEALGRDQRRARAALLEQRVRAHGHPVGEDLDVARLGARPLQHGLDRRQHAARTGRPASWAPWPCAGRSPSKRTASVNVPPTSTPSSMRAASQNAGSRPDTRGPRLPGALSLSVSLRLAGLVYTAASEPCSLSSVSTALSGISALSNVSSRCLCDGQ